MLITPTKIKENSIDQEYLESLIRNKIEENDQLDYKREVTKDNAEIAKDISSFANTIGGNILYGIEEEENKPKRIIPINNKDLRERIDQIAHNGIDPPLNIKIWPIDVNIESTHGQVFIIYIPKKYPLLHFAKSKKRYYKRTNFTSTPMEKYEIDLAYKISLEFKEKLKEELKEIEHKFLKEIGNQSYSFIFSIYPTQYGERLFKIDKEMNHFLQDEFPKTPIYEENLLPRRSLTETPIFRQNSYVFKSEIGYHNADCLIRTDGIIIYILHFKILPKEKLELHPVKNLKLMFPFERLNKGIVFHEERVFRKEYFIDIFLGLIDFLYNFYSHIEYFGDVNLIMKFRGALHEWVEEITKNKFRQTIVDPIENSYSIELIPRMKLRMVKETFNPLFNGFGIIESDLDDFYNNLQSKLQK